MIFRLRRLILVAVLPAALTAACGGQSKTTSTTTTHKSTPSAQSGHYHAGEQCQKSQSFAYSSQGFTCVNGKLRHKGQHGTPATVHHHSQTTTAAPQGY